MNREERAALLTALPSVLTVYRGYNRPYAKCGLSWSIDKGVAATMPLKRFRGPANPWLLTGKIERRRIVAHLDGRNEQEVIVDPSDVVILATRRRPHA